MIQSYPIFFEKPPIYDTKKKNLFIPIISLGNIYTSISGKNHSCQKKKKKKIFDKVEKFSNILNLLGTQPDGSSSIFRRGFPRKRDRRGVSRNCSFQKRRSVIRGADNGSWAGGRTLRSQQRSNVSLPVILIVDREFAVVRYFQRFTGVGRK